eukprot:gene9212-biopygen6095
MINGGGCYNLPTRYMDGGLNETSLFAQVEAMATTLRPHGWTHVLHDYGWQVWGHAVIFRWGGGESFAGASAKRAPPTATSWFPHGSAIGRRAWWGREVSAAVSRGRGGGRELARESPLLRQDGNI